MSKTLNTNAKIYGYRVDYVHNSLYKLLGGLNRSETNAIKSKIGRDEKSDDEDDEEKVRKYAGNEENTLEKRETNITVDHYDIEFDIDPLFKKTTALFDESSSRGLLLNNLMVDGNLKI